jgi:hypothetical protein
MQENNQNPFSPEISNLFAKLKKSIDSLENTGKKKRKTTGAFGGKRKNNR